MADERTTDGTRAGSRTTWPSHDVVEGWLGDVDLDLEPDPDPHLDTVPGEQDAPVAGLSGDVHVGAFREALGSFATGITVVTATSGGVPVGLTCQSFASVSLDPPLVLFCPARSSRAWPLIQRSGGFCVNILAADQAEVSNTMASRGIDKFAKVLWSPSRETGSPVLPGALAHLDCTIEAVHDGGDHHVVIGRVQHLEVHDSGDGLLFFRGRYGSASI